jgi:hypothetical protein
VTVRDRDTLKQTGSRPAKLAEAWGKRVLVESRFFPGKTKAVISAAGAEATRAEPMTQPSSSWEV